jgi:6-phosphogluconolactonase
VIKAQNEGVAKRDKFTLAVSGGSLPKILAKDLIGRNDVKWDKWCVFECCLFHGAAFVRCRLAFSPP